MKTETENLYELDIHDVAEIVSWFDFYIEALGEHYLETIEEHPENETIAHETLMELRERAITTFKKLG